MLILFMSGCLIRRMPFVFRMSTQSIKRVVFLKKKSCLLLSLCFLRRCIVLVFIARLKEGCRPNMRVTPPTQLAIDFSRYKQERGISHEISSR
jgi:hypothetical protein